MKSTLRQIAAINMSCTDIMIIIILFVVSLILILWLRWVFVQFLYVYIQSFVYLIFILDFFSINLMLAFLLPFHLFFVVLLYNLCFYNSFIVVYYFDMKNVNENFSIINFLLFVNFRIFIFQNLDPKKCVEWYVTASKADCQELLKLAKDEPRLVHKKVSSWTWWICEKIFDNLE